MTGSVPTDTARHRGTGKTIPLSCYKTETERREASLRNPNVNGNASDTTVGRLWATGNILADDCYANGKDVGDLIGFAFTARDYMRVVDALEEDGLLRYYGSNPSPPPTRTQLH